MPDRQSFTYTPLALPKPVTDGVWMVDGPVERMRAGPVSIPFPTRMTIIARGDDLWLHSPVELTTGLGGAVEALGRVRWLIAPSWLHYAGVPSWQEAFPEAQVWAAKGVAERAEQSGIGLHIDRALDQEPRPWDDEIDQFTLHSRFGDEVEFFHRPSRTLILTDLIENFAPERMGALWGLALRIGGVLGPDGGTPWDYRAALTDRAAVRREVERMIAMDPARVILAHGDPYLENPVPRLRHALAWALEDEA